MMAPPHQLFVTKSGKGLKEADWNENLWLAKMPAHSTSIFNIEKKIH